MELRHVRSFVETARAGTYAAAAASLHTAQPAVWKHVRMLEAELGVALFERAGRRVRLTGAGTLLLERAVQLIEGADRVEELAVALREGQAGTVTIGCVAPHVLGFLGRAMAAFRKARPDARVQVHEVNLGLAATGDPFAEALHSGAVDVVTGPSVPGADSFAVYEASVFCAVPSRHPWRTETTIDVERLRDVPLLTAPRGFFSRDTLERACQAAGFDPRVEIELGNPAVLVALGVDGLGVPIVASDTIATPARPWPSIAAGDTTLSTTIWLSARRQLDPAAAEFVRLAREIAPQD